LRNPLIGLAGKPNVGKSTFFSAATLASVPIANYPFTTVKANVGITYVAVDCVCREFGVQDNPVNSACIGGRRFIPVKMVDCPGLVPGAWEGRGLGNQFLDEVRKADVLLLVVDAAGSTDMDGKPCKPGLNDPLQDVAFLEKEFDMWIFQILKKDWDRIARKAETLGENIVGVLSEKLAGLQIRRQDVFRAVDELGLQAKKPTRWTEGELQNLAKRLRKLAKPLLIVANKIDLEPAEENVARLREAGYAVVPCSAEAELVLRRADEKGMIEYKPGDKEFKILQPQKLTVEQTSALRAVEEKVLKKFGSTGVQEALDFALFRLLGMVAIFPVEDVEKLTDHEGRVLPDCYLVPPDTGARDLAGMIHSELAETFIYAVEAKSKRRVGEDYRIKHRDVIKIVSSKGRA